MPLSWYAAGRPKHTGGVGGMHEPGKRHMAQSSHSAHRSGEYAIEAFAGPRPFHPLEKKEGSAASNWARLWSPILIDTVSGTIFLPRCRSSRTVSGQQASGCSGRDTAKHSKSAPVLIAHRSSRQP